MKEAVQRFWAKLFHKGVFVSGADCVDVADDMVSGGLARKSVGADGEPVWTIIPEEKLSNAGRRRLARFQLGDRDWKDESERDENE